MRIAIEEMEQTFDGAPVACYREFAPHPALMGRVRALFSFSWCVEPARTARRVILERRFAATDRYSSPLFADGNCSIVFDLGTSFYAGRGWRTTPLTHGSRIIGAMSRASSDFRRELPAMVGAYFEPGHAAAFAHVPASELADRILALEDVWGATAAELAERLVCLDEAARLYLVEHVLLRKLERWHDCHLTVDVPALAQFVVRERGRATIASLADSAGISRQHLTRVFRERVGISPKVYSRLARFQAALVHTRSGRRADWSRVAAEMGYADQSHMIAEFREFSGLTPNLLATERWFHPFIERAAAARRSPISVLAPR